MLFQFNINLTEDDYLAFNYFHATESDHGKKLIRNTRIIFTLIMVGLMALVVLLIGWTTLSITYVMAVVAFTALYVARFKKVIMRNIKKQIVQMKKLGKLPFDPVATMEFYEDSIVEITASSRSEQKYTVLERVCVVADRYIFLYHSSATAYLLPIPQVKDQADQKAFLDFISQKCNTVEYY